MSDLPYTTAEAAVLLEKAAKEERLSPIEKAALKQVAENFGDLVKAVDDKIAFDDTITFRKTSDITIDTEELNRIYNKYKPNGGTSSLSTALAKCVGGIGFATLIRSYGPPSVMVDVYCLDGINIKHAYYRITSEASSPVSVELKNLFTTTYKHVVVLKDGNNTEHKIQLATNRADPFGSKSALFDYLSGYYYTGTVNYAPAFSPIYDTAKIVLVWNNIATFAAGNAICVSNLTSLEMPSGVENLEWIDTTNFTYVSDTVTPL